MDAIVALLEQVGPCDIVIATWTAAQTDMTTMRRMLDDDRIRTMRWIVDRSFQTRKPADCAAIRRAFGDAAIRTTSSHAKFVVMRNEKWDIAMRTSMNLNQNPRLENIEISDDRDLAAFLWSVADELFGEQSAGEFDGKMPLLDGLDDIDRPGRVRVSSAPRIG